MGFIIEHKGYRAGLKQMGKLEKHIKSTTKKQFLNILRIMQWYRPGIVNFSEKLIPITNKLQINK